MLASASSTESGVPQQLLDAKMEEVRKKREQEAVAAAEMQARKEAAERFRESLQERPAGQSAPRVVPVAPPAGVAAAAAAGAAAAAAMAVAAAAAAPGPPAGGFPPPPPVQGDAGASPSRQEERDRERGRCVPVVCLFWKRGGRKAAGGHVWLVGLLTPAWACSRGPGVRCCPGVRCALCNPARAKPDIIDGVTHASEPAAGPAP